MIWKEIESCFHRAFVGAFSKFKLLLTFFALVLCGLLIVFCKAVAFHAGDWIAMSLFFLPVLFSSGILLSLGVLLVRLYTHESKRIHLSWRRLFSGSLNLIFGTIYLSVSPIFIYLLLWIILGFFRLLSELPGIGAFFSVIFAFGPFLLILSSLLLCLFNLMLLFFITPSIATEPFKKASAGKKLFQVLKGQLLSGIVLFLIALAPSAVAAGLLTFSAMLNQVGMSVERQSLSLALEWFMIMLPFCALLAPSVIFFFQFAAESFWLLRRKAALLNS